MFQIWERLLHAVLIVSSYSFSDDESDDEFACETESFLLSKMGLAESALYEVINDHQTEVKVRQIDILAECVFRLVYIAD